MGELTKEGQRRTRILQRIKGFRLLDDAFMSKCFEDSRECVELVLRIVLEKDDLKVQEVHTQYLQKNLQGRSVCLDVYATDSQGTRYNIEVQRGSKGAAARRARYHSSVLDVNVLEAGADFADLPETYVIFITEHDVWQANRALYSIERYIRSGEQLLPFGDGAHILYVNGAYRGSNPIGRLMHDFSCTDPQEMYYPVLADRVSYFKDEKKGAEEMSSVMDEWIEEERDDVKREVAQRLLAGGKYQYEEIAEVLALSVEELDALLDQQSA